MKQPNFDKLLPRCPLSFRPDHFRDAVAWLALCRSTWHAPPIEKTMSTRTCQNQASNGVLPALRAMRRCGHQALRTQNQSRVATKRCGFRGLWRRSTNRFRVRDTLAARRGLPTRSRAAAAAWAWRQLRLAIRAVPSANKLSRYSVTNETNQSGGQVGGNASVADRSAQSAGHQRSPQRFVHKSVVVCVLPRVLCGTLLFGLRNDC